MINSLQLENFKAFGDPVTIELAPITLIFGENSAGIGGEAPFGVVND